MTTKMKTLITIVKPYTPFLVLAAILAVVVSYIDQLIPLLVRDVVNKSFTAGGQMPWGLMSMFALYVLLIQILRIVQRLFTEWASTRLGIELFAQGIRYLLSHPVSWFAENHSGAVQVRLSRSSQAITDLMKLMLGEMLAPLVSVIIATVLIVKAAPLVGIVVMVMVPCLVLLTYWQARSQAGIRISINAAREEQGVRITEACEGIEQVKYFRAIRQETTRARNVAGEMASKEFRHHKAMASFDFVKFMSERIGYVLVLIMGIQVAIHPGSQLGVGGVLMLLMLFDRIAEPVRHLHRIIDETNEKMLLATDYMELLDATPDDHVQEDFAVRNNPGDICFSRVNFVYPGAEQAAISNASFTVPFGNKVAIIGPSGSGKSTIAKLLTGIYLPDAGTISIGDMRVMPIEKPTSSAHVGVLTQEVYLFAGTVDENIRYGNPSATNDDVRRAAQIAGIDERIQQLPKGYMTFLGQRGVGLSGGEKQRLALARVIMQNPEIVILDEPSASLDPANTRRFFESVIHSFTDKTVLVITHNHDILEWADTILKVEHGQVTAVDGKSDKQRIEAVA